MSSIDLNSARMEESSQVHRLPESSTGMPYTETKIRRSKKRRRQSSTLLFFVFILSTAPQFASSFVCLSPPLEVFNRCDLGAFQARRNNRVSNGGNGDSRRHSASKQSRRNDNTMKQGSGSRSRAINALSQPNLEEEQVKSNGNRNSKKRSLKKRIKQNEKSQETQAATAVNGKQEQTQNKEDNPDPLDSLLLPPLSAKSKGSIGKRQDQLGSGLSSWEDFLSVGKARKKELSTLKKKYSKMKSPRSVSSMLKKTRRQTENNPGERKSSSSNQNSKRELPAISDLFPTDMYAKSRQGKDVANTPFPPALDGVLPVSDLFYRSSQSMNEDDEVTHEDDELPFSAEQSDQLTTVHNKIKIRRNQAKNSGNPRGTLKRKSSKNRRMVRRGMEMLVGGVPINADPPQRCIELVYDTKESADWNERVVTNSRDFGPMYHSSSVTKVSEIEKGLFCEHFVHSALKWNICPDDLKSIAKEYLSSISNGDDDDQDIDFEAADSSSVESSSNADSSGGATLGDVAKTESTETESTETSTGSFGTLTSFKKSVGADAHHVDADGNPRLGGEIVFSIGVSSEDLRTCIPTDAPVLERVLARGIASATELKGFDVSFENVDLTDMDDGTTLVSGSFFLSLEDSGSMTNREMEKRAGQINNSLALAMDEGDVQLAMAAAAKEESGWPEEIRNRVVEEFLFDDDDGDGPLYDFDADKEENDLSSQPIQEKKSNGSSSLDVTNDVRDTYDGPFGMPGGKTFSSDDLFLGGGNDGVFWNYSEENIAGAPYGGQLGLRLVDAVTQRAKERQPRVIAIGDVHGCIDELQDLLRECDYRPGDLVVFLGDLVSKGPDSISVVQLAREIGAIGVRGNHDFEVVRWHQAIKSGVDPPVVGSEHFHIASCLSNADMKWMYSLPWYISSKELGALFVHAGFVSGIRLGKQNPRLMMNMRSILPDGTVTSKFFNNWPWARLWDGPKTVLFGHDADRGLQQYEHALGLDTGCVYGGRLTACVLPEKRLVSVSAKREYFKYRRKHYD